MVISFHTPVRRLEDITYWVIEDSAAINDFVNTEIRREWEEDARNEYKGPEDDEGIQTIRNFGKKLAWLAKKINTKEA